MPDPQTLSQSTPVNVAATSPVRRVGVIGGGQLAWMMAGAADKLGLELLVQTPSNQDPAVVIADKTILAPIADAIATAQLARECDVITFENEFVDLQALTNLVEQGVCFRPRLEALQPILDKYHQRTFLQTLGLPTPTFYSLDHRAIAPQIFPIVLKTRRHGYDGQGTFILKTSDDWEKALERLVGVPLLVEEFIPFQRELAVMAARGINGEVVTYPVVETYQQDQVCRWVIAPAQVSPAVTTQVAAIARTILTHLDVVGIVGIELFLTAEEQVLVNEIAPRTHNSGHFTLDACETSQFEQQLRAVCGLPLGDPTMGSAAAVMVNLLGYEHSNHDYGEKRQQLAQIPQAYVHWYGKTESRPGRKLGHVTVLLEDAAEGNQRDRAIAIAKQIESIWYGHQPNP